MDISKFQKHFELIKPQLLSFGKNDIIKSVRIIDAELENIAFELSASFDDLVKYNNYLLEMICVINDELNNILIALSDNYYNQELKNNCMLMITILFKEVNELNQSTINHLSKLLENDNK